MTEVRETGGHHPLRSVPDSKELSATIVHMFETGENWTRVLKSGPSKDLGFFLLLLFVLLVGFKKKITTEHSLLLNQCVRD